MEAHDRVVYLGVDHKGIIDIVKGVQVQFAALFYIFRQCYNLIIEA